MAEKTWTIEEIQEVATEIGYPEKIQKTICQWVKENTDDNRNGKTTKQDIKEQLVYYYIESNESVYFDIYGALWGMLPGEPHPATANDFIYETMVDILANYKYNEFDNNEKIEKIAKEQIKNTQW